MSRLLQSIPSAVGLTLMLASCQTTPPASTDTGTNPSAKPAISQDLKELYMNCSAAPPQSAAQQALVRKMAEKSSNAQELLLTMRAAAGVFPEADPAARRAHEELCSTVARKMVRVANLEQLIDYVSRFPVNPADSRAVAERMFQLAEFDRDAHTWVRLRRAASALKQEDLTQRARAKAGAFGASTTDTAH